MTRELLQVESGLADDSALFAPQRQSIFRNRGGRLVLLALAFAAGIAASNMLDRAIAWFWIIGASVALASTCVGYYYRRPLAWPLLLAAVAFLGAARLNVHHFQIAPNDIAVIASEQPMIVRLTGTLTDDAEMRRPGAGSMAAFDYRRPSTSFPLRVDGIVSDAGVIHAAAGKVYVRVEQTLPPLYAGDRVTVFGSLRAPGRPRNPGEFDYAEYARSLGQAGIITVPLRELVEIAPAPRSAMYDTFTRWRGRLQQSAGAWLLSDLPAADARQNALLAALLLGQREPELDDVNESFQRTGLAHLLAISGMHLGVVVLGVVALARMLAVRERWHGLILLFVTLAYLALVEVRMPVLRAAVMVIAAGLAMSLGRRIRVGGAIALAAVAVLLWRPDQLFTAGFQLSFGVVLALAALAPLVRMRWFGRPDMNPLTVGAMFQEWFKTTLASAVVAWMVATPIIAYHFAFLCPLAAPLSVVAIPLTAILLLVGYVKIVLSAALPSAALLAGAPLSFAAQVLLALVTVIDDMPGATVDIPFPSPLWALGATIWVCAWCAAGLYDRAIARPRWPLIVALGILSLWLYWPRMAAQTDAALRLDVLAVGDGSCSIMRSAGETFVFDAGSQNLSAGDRTIVPAMRRMNITKVHALAISHANLDHYSAVIEIVDAFHVREVLVTSAFERAVARDLSSSAAFLMQQLAGRNVAVRAVDAGYTRPFGNASLTWLHPPDIDFERVNDTSMVIRADCADRSLLLTGDIQQHAIERLLRETPDQLRVDVTEIPHHGSYNEPAIALLTHIDPAIAFQSCGWSRFERDQWHRHLPGVDRLITARDGACHVEIHDDGSMSVGRYLTP